MQTVAELLETKGRNVWSIDASQSVLETIQEMANKEVGALVVVDGDNKLAGIVSERDYARKVLLRNKSAEDTLVADIMTSDVVSVQVEQSVDVCMSLMNHHNIRHLPVLDGAEPVGMITIGDVLKAIIDDQTETIDELESMIFEDQGGEG